MRTANEPSADAARAGAVCAELLYGAMLRPFAEANGDAGALVAQALAGMPRAGTDALATSFARMFERERAR